MKASKISHYVLIWVFVHARVRLVMCVGGQLASHISAQELFSLCEWSVSSPIAMLVSGLCSGATWLFGLTQMLLTTFIIIEFYILDYWASHYHINIFARYLLMCRSDGSYEKEFPLVEFNNGWIIILLPFLVLLSLIFLMSRRCTEIGNYNLSSCNQSGCNRACLWYMHGSGFICLDLSSSWFTFMDTFLNTLILDAII